MTEPREGRPTKNQLSHANFYRLTEWMKTNEAKLLSNPWTYGQIAEKASADLGLPISGTYSIRSALEAVGYLDKMMGAGSRGSPKADAAVARDLLLLASLLDQLFAGMGKGHPKELSDLIVRLRLVEAGKAAK